MKCRARYTRSENNGWYCELRHAKWTHNVSGYGFTRADALKRAIDIAWHLGYDEAMPLKVLARQPIDFLKAMGFRD